MVYYSLSAWPPSVASLTPARLSKASPGAAPPLQLLLHGTHSTWGAPAPLTCLRLATGAAQTGHRALHTVIFPPLIYKMQLRNLSRYSLIFSDLSRGTHRVLLRKGEWWAYITSGLGWGNVETWLFADLTPCRSCCHHWSLFFFFFNLGPVAKE